MEINCALTWRMLSCTALLCGLVILPVLGHDDATTTPASADAQPVPDYINYGLIRELLFNNYQKDVRPAVNHAQPMNIDFEITLVKMADLNEIAHTISMSYILYKGWFDPRLKWNQSHFGGIENMSIPVDQIWKPDVSLFNVADQSYAHVYGGDALVRHDGKVMWVPMITSESYCSLNFLKFPFDSQVCYLKFGSWIYSAQEVRFSFVSKPNASETDAGVYITDEGKAENKEWKVTEFKQRHEIITYSEDIPKWAEVTVTIRLRRLGRYYQSLYVAPIVLLAILNPIVFLLPADATEKPILGSLILLAICTLLINLQTVIQPAHVTIPRLVMFYVSTLVLTSFSVFSSSLVCHLARKNKRLRGVPAWLSSIFLGRCGLRRVLCVETYSPVSRFDALVTMGDGVHMEGESATEMDGPAQNPSHNELREIRKCLHAIASRMNSDDSIQSLSRDWYEIARVLDRMLFIMFYVLLFLTAIAFLL